MNVLAKIVIPKTNVTSMYIMSEMEEFAREEFFRLKKILEIKRKMFVGSEEKKKEPVMCITCQPSTEWGVIDRCIECDALVLPEDQKSKEDEKLEEFKTHLSEILNITKDMDVQGVIAVSVEKFVKSAEQLKEKLQQKSESVQTEREKVSYDTVFNQLCEVCKKKYLAEKAAAVQQPEIEPAKEEVKPEPESLSKPKSKSIIKPVTHEQPAIYEQESDLELGTFETEIKEITKVIRVKREDGSVTEERKIITVKREIRTPLKASKIPPPNPINQERAGRIIYQPSGTSATSSKSSPYSGSRTVGVVTTKSLDYFPFHFIPIQTKARSEVFNPPSPMFYPVVRYCVSSVTLLSVDFGEYSPIPGNSHIDCNEGGLN